MISKCLKMLNKENFDGVNYNEDIIVESLSEISISKILEDDTKKEVNPEVIKIFCDAFNKVASESSPETELELKEKRN